MSRSTLGVSTDRSQSVKRSAITGTAAIAAAAAIVLSGGGSGTKTEPSTSTSASNTTSATTSATAAPSSKPRVAPRDEDAKGPNPTIASYVAENTTQEPSTKRADRGSPTIALPIPDGWRPAGDDTP